MKSDFLKRLFRGHKSEPAAAGSSTSTGADDPVVVARNFSTALSGFLMDAEDIIGLDEEAFDPEGWVVYREDLLPAVTVYEGVRHEGNYAVRVLFATPLAGGRVDLWLVATINPDGGTVVLTGTRTLFGALKQAEVQTRLCIAAIRAAGAEPKEAQQEGGAL